MQPSHLHRFRKRGAQNRREEVWFCGCNVIGVLEVNCFTDCNRDRLVHFSFPHLEGRIRKFMSSYSLETPYDYTGGVEAVIEAVCVMYRRWGQGAWIQPRCAL